MSARNRKKAPIVLITAKVAGPSFKTTWSKWLIFMPRDDVVVKTQGFGTTRSPAGPGLNPIVEVALDKSLS